MSRTPSPLSINSRSACVIFNFTLDLSAGLLTCSPFMHILPKLPFFRAKYLDRWRLLRMVLYMSYMKTTGLWFDFFFFFLGHVFNIVNTFRNIVCFTQIPHSSVWTLSASFSRGNSCKFRLVTCSQTSKIQCPRACSRLLNEAWNSISLSKRVTVNMLTLPWCRCAVLPSSVSSFFKNILC